MILIRKRYKHYLANDDKSCKIRLTSVKKSFNFIQNSYQCNRWDYKFLKLKKMHHRGPKA